MTEIVSSPRATRLSLPTWLDARLALGALLVLLSVAAGARVFASADHFTAVFVAAHDLVPGEHVSADDLAVGRVRLQGQGALYVGAAAAPPVGYVVTRFVGAHEFLPAGALAPAAAASRSRLVTVPIQPGHLADDLSRGDLVDLYLTPKTGAGQAVPAPTLVLASVPVDAREGGTRTFSGTAALSVVLAVPTNEVPAVVHAVESGVVDLVTVPRADAAASSDPSAAR